MTPLQQEIYDVLTDEPQTASEIAAQLDRRPRVVANSLVWMRSMLLADDGGGFDNGAGISFPSAPWYRYNKPKWVRLSLSKRYAINELHHAMKTGHAKGLAS